MYRTVLRMSECKSTNRDTVICPQYGATARACDAAVSGWPWLRSLGSLSLRLSGWPAVLGSGVEHCCSPFVSREQRWVRQRQVARSLRKAIDWPGRSGTLDRPQKGKQVAKQALGRAWADMGRRWLNALPGPSGAYHAAPKLAMPWPDRDELETVRREGCVRALRQRQQFCRCAFQLAVLACANPGLVVCLFPLARWPNSHRQPRPGRASPGSPDMLWRGVAFLKVERQ